MRHFLFPTLSDSLFRDVFDASHASSFIDETDSTYLIQLDMPGVKKEDLKISLEAQHLVVEGQRKGRGLVRKVYSLPDDVDLERIEAQLADGVLELALHKKEQVKPKTIAVKEGKESFFKAIESSGSCS